MATMRPEIQGTKHVVSTGHPFASQAAFQILENGGNAIDAGVCAGIALGVLLALWLRGDSLDLFLCFDHIGGSLGGLLGGGLLGCLLGSLLCHVDY